jgi:hypothetical protein
VAGRILPSSDPVVAAEEWVALHPNLAGQVGHGQIGQGEANQDQQGAPP